MFLLHTKKYSVTVTLNRFARIQLLENISRYYVRLLKKFIVVIKNQGQNSKNIYRPPTKECGRCNR